MTRRAYLAVLLITAFIALAALPVLAQDAKAPGAKKMGVVLKSFTGPKGMQGIDKLEQFATDFISRDVRYTVTRKATDQTTHTVGVVMSGSQKGLSFTLTTEIIGEAPKTFTATLDRRPSLARVEAAIAEGIRTTFEYRPVKDKVLIKILGKAAEGDAYGETVEDLIFEGIQSEYNRVDANPSKLPVKDDDVPKLMKGSKAELKAIHETGQADLLIVGTVTVPKTKNIGGTTNNLYYGKAIVAIKVWDLKRQHLVSNISITLDSKGAFSDLIYSLFEGTGKKAAEMVSADLGFPKAKADDAAKEN